jgi:hypothetical protein
MILFGMSADDRFLRVSRQRQVAALGRESAFTAQCTEALATGYHGPEAMPVETGQARPAACFPEPEDEWRADARRRVCPAPDMWQPVPGALTGVILSPGGAPVYLSGLGDALVELDR